MFSVTLKARKPPLATFKFDGDNINITFVMRAPRLTVNVRSEHFFVVDHHKLTEICFSLLDFELKQNLRSLII